MGEIELLQEKPLSMVEVNEILQKVKKRDTELNKKSLKVEGYINKFNKITLKQREGIIDKLNKLEISRLNNKTISKIIDINPEDIDSLKIILSGENLTLKQEDLKKVLECL